MYAETMNKLANGGTPETPYEIATASVRKPENVEAMKIVLEQKDIRMKNYFQRPLTGTMKSKNELLKKLVLQMFSKIIYGQDLNAAFLFACDVSPSYYPKRLNRP